MSKLKRQKHILPALLVIGVSIGVVTLAMIPMFRLNKVSGALLTSNPIPAVIATKNSLDGRGVQIKAPEGISMLFIGDMMFGREVAHRMQLNRDPAYPFRKMPTDWISQFDFAIGNLEGPVTTERHAPEKSIDFIFQPNIIPVLKSEGFDGVSQANNHSFDQGRIGHEDSMKRLKDAGLIAFGEQVKDGEEALAFADIQGKRFAFLGFNTTDNPLDREAAAAVIKQAKADSDFVIVMIHWGVEYHDTPEPSVIATAHWLIDEGADMIIGGHPHWEQGISVYKNKPIAWSLGNFIFDQDWSVKTREGLALGVTIYNKKITMELFPLSIVRSQPEILTEDGRKKRLESIAEVSDATLREQISNGKIVVNQ